VSGITAIDTIGAGDNFASGFISALLEGAARLRALLMQRLQYRC
jgi:sugar/nucleoside kinase (ribokinase family)